MRQKYFIQGNFGLNPTYTLPNEAMTKRYKILLLIPHLGGGGAEQVMALLARGLSRDKYEMHLGLITQPAPEPGVVPPWVSVHAFEAPRIRSSALALLRLIRRLQPDVILSGIAHLNFLVLLLKPFFPKKTRVIVRQNATISAALAYGGLPRYTGLLYRMLYRHADHVICQSKAMAEDMAEVLGAHNASITVLPNPVDLEGIRAAANGPSQWNSPGPHLLAVGRLSSEKGFDLLLEAMAQIRKLFPTADLTILGSGPEQDRLQAQSHALALDEAVRFAGYVPKPYGFYRDATLFVLSSRHEGMSNALLEAAAGGLPVVATPASGGVVEWMKDQSNAWLTKEISANSLAQTLLEALTCLSADSLHRSGTADCLPSTKSPCGK
jgi:glycosyltransferase involved in cell wall biosynthesis